MTTKKVVGYLTRTAEFDNGNSGAADTIDFNNGNNQKSTITANTTLTFTAPSGPSRIQLKIIQDALGPWTVTLPTVKTPLGAGYTATATINAVDILTLWYDGTDYLLVANLDIQK